MVHAVAPVFFLVMLLISGIYQLPYLDVPNLGFSKRILFVCFMIMLGSTLRWREAIGSRFTWLCGIWVLVNMGHWLLRWEYADIYFQRMVQIAFIWVFVNYILQQREEDRKPFLGLQVLFYPPFFALFCMLVVMFSFNAEISRMIAHGFGGNRFGFSIWLSQFVFLTFFVYLNSKSQSIRKAILWVTPILILQIFTGGRTGILASFAIFLYFAYQQGGFRAIILCVPYLVTVIIFGTALSNWIGIYGGVGGGESIVRESIVRITTAIPSANHLFNGNESLQWLDRLSSYRLSIMTNAFSTIDTLSLLFGAGVENFKGGLPTGTMANVHGEFNYEVQL
jgi:hypothetical protein